jgi:ABC-type glycerol-3-phosphate transport system substrate-binding protein
MTHKTSRFRQAVGIALVASMAVLAGCGSSPSSTSTTTEQSSSTTPAPMLNTTTTTTNRQMQSP